MFRRLVALIAAFTSFGIASAQTPITPSASEIEGPVPDIQPVASEPIPAAPVATPCPTACSPGFDFKNVPYGRPQPRLGYFPVPPTGPGAYSIVDAVRGTPSAGPPKYPYARFGLSTQPSYDLEFKYLDKPDNTECDFYDPVKRMRLGNDFLLSIGGQSWVRGMYEYNSRLGTRNNDYLLDRQRLYGDLWYQDRVRLFVEGIAAFTGPQGLAPLPIDDTGFDFINLFVDLKLGDVWSKPAYLRVGRQELQFGSQRLISPLDWANTRRTFQGVNVLRTGENWDFNAFWVQPVATNPNQLDWARQQQDLSGVFATYKPKKGTTVDLYDLVTTNNSTVVQRGIQRGNSTINTMGARYAGDENSVLFDFESALQLGRLGGENVVAGMATAGLGYNWKCLPWNPTLWAYYDYASGDNTPGRKGNNTFNQLFPFGHYYLGWADAVGRQNIHDVSAHLYLYPRNWLTLNVQYHNFHLASSRDALYNAAGNVSRYDPTGKAGKDVGNEIDTIVNFHVSKHTDVLVGHAYLFAGDYIKKTAAAGQTGGFDTSLFFIQANYRW